MFQTLTTWYTEYFGPANAVPGIFHLPFLGYPTPILCMVVVYLSFILKIGPTIMKNRKPYDLKVVLLVYNSMQFFINFIIFYYSCVSQIRQGFFALQRWPLIQHPLKPIETWTSYAFFLMKIFDFLDTIFFVLRRSYRQVSFLHVYHHLTVVFWTYLAMHFNGAGGMLSLVKTFNTFVHCVMYGYYLINAQFPQHRNQIIKYKKYITRIQLILFAIGIFFASYAVLRIHSVKGFDFFSAYSLA